MVTSLEPVCVTGMAWSTALGSSLDGVWKSLLAGETGLADIASAYSLRNTRAAVVADVPLELPAWQRQQQLTRTTLADAVTDSGLSSDDPRIRPVLGTSYGPHLEESNTTSLSRWSMIATRDSGFVNEPVTVSTACSSGSDAFVAGYGLLTTGAAEICVCGGVDVLTIGKRLGHSHLGTMSADDLRAFDVRHNGTLLGEGAAFLVLEHERSARARGARVYGTLAGVGSSHDSASAVAPEPGGANVILAVDRALRTAGIEPADISIINAHGSGTPVNDDVEAGAYGRLFEHVSARPVVFATKGAFGHTLGATGAIEAIALLQALRTGCAPPVHGLSTPIPQLRLPVPMHESRDVGSGYGISVTLGFGGFDTCLAFRAGACGDGR